MDKYFSCKTERKGGSYWTNRRIIKENAFAHMQEVWEWLNGLPKKENLHKGEYEKPVVVQENVILVDQNNDANAELAAVMKSNHFIPVMKQVNHVMIILMMLLPMKI